MIQIIDYKHAEPYNNYDLNNMKIISTSPGISLLEKPMKLKILPNASRNRVQITATVGLRGMVGISQIVFKFKNNGESLYKTIVAVESPNPVFDANYFFTFQHVEMDMKPGDHMLDLKAANINEGCVCNLNGPISFTALAMALQ